MFRTDSCNLTIFINILKRYTNLREVGFRSFRKDEYENEGGLSQQEYLDSLALLNVDASRYQNPYPGY